MYAAALGSDAVHKTLTVAGLKQQHGKRTSAILFLVCVIYSAGVFLLHSITVMIAAEFWCMILLGHLIFSVVSDTDDRKLSK